MNSTSSDWSPPGTANPFSPTAVARVSEFAGDTITIATPAVRQARQLLDDYIASSATVTGEGKRTDIGNVLAIVGDYGTGKTHLAVELLRYARHVSTEETPVIYLDAPADTFVALYKRFISGLQRAEVRARVREYYADVLINSLREAELTAEVADRAGIAHLLHRGDLSPEDVFDTLGLSETTSLQQLQRRLQDVSENPIFGTVLTLLARPGFETVAWDWLLGYEPDQILVERGIATTIDNDAIALEAMGVIALLYGHRNRRFVLIVDELDKVLSASNAPPADVVSAFKTLLRVFTGARAFLVLCGLPDFLNVLGLDLQQRIGHIVTMSALTGEDVCQFIKESQELTFGVAQLEPFTLDTVEYLVRLTAGTPRRVIRLCYQVYRQAVEDCTLVAEAMVRQVARSHFDVASSLEVRAEVRRVIVTNGWDYHAGYAIGPIRVSKVDYWIPVGGQGGGCAVLIAESVLDSGDLDKLNRRALAIRAVATDIEIVLVINGYLASNVATELAGVFGSEPLVYAHRSFAEDLAAIIKAALHRLENVIGEDTLTVVRERVDRINRQQTNTHGFIEQVAVRLDELHSATGRQFNTLQRGMEDLYQALSGMTGSSRPSRVPVTTTLPVELSRIFDNALEALSGLDQVVALLAYGFIDQSQEPTLNVEAKSTIISIVNTPKTVLSVGVAVLLQGLIKAFRHGVMEWYSSVVLAPEDQGHSKARERLAAICHIYDEYYEHFPPLRLDALSEFSRLGDEDDHNVFRMTRTSRRIAAQATLENLSQRVYHAALSAIDSRPEG